VEFGEDALAQALAAAADRGLDDCILQGVAAAERHSGASEFGDDVCVLAAELKSAAVTGAPRDREHLPRARDASSSAQSR
jgi:hypothetical protein